MNLNDRVAVVTGGASGIGAATAEALRAEGARVVMWDLDPAATDVVCDVGDEESVAAAMETTVERFGLPSILVTSAGVFSGSPIVSLSIEEWDRIQRVNLRGTFLCVRAVAQALVAAGEPGSIVLVGSVNGVVADPTTAAYSASKAAVMHFGRVAARELGAYGIRVNSVGPGPTDTAMMSTAKALPGYLDSLQENTPLGRVGTPADIAEAIVGVLGMDWVTGQAIVVDGGAGLATARGRIIAERTTILT